MSLDEVMNYRVDSEKKKLFIKKCNALGRSYQDVQREIVDAFNDNRLTITPTKAQKAQMNEVYK